jgi:subtilase family serine protease
MEHQRAVPEEAILTVTRSLTAILCFAAIGFAAEDRIREPVETINYAPVPGSVSPKTRLYRDVGVLDPATRINGIKLVLIQSDLQHAASEQLLEQQRDPASPEYQNWLTPEQYAERFGVSENDLARISSWLQARGFVVEQVARARNWITFNGTAGQITRTFRAELHRVEIDGVSGKEAHFANTSEAWIPSSLTGIVGSIRGLDDFRPRPQRVKSLLHPEFNSPNGTHYLSPGDLAAIYDIQALYTAGFDGAGQNLVIAGQTDINLADLRAFRAAFNLPARDPQLVLVGADPGADEGDQIEANLDLEWSGAVARNATIIYVYSQNVFDSIQYAIDQNLAPVMSMSYGGCELESPSSFRALAQQANAQGITWLNSSGDSGAAGCDLDAQIATQGPAATFPASIPEVTAVGGTEFNDVGGTYWNPLNGLNSVSALSYIPETAWNDTPLGSGLASGGGAPSLVYPKPWWQTGPGVPNDQARDVPDISLAASGAHDGYLMYFRGELMAVGGTSASSPSFAGIVSILSQYLAAKGAISKPGLGNINPALYHLAQNTTGLFHDITVGNNTVPCASGSKGCVTGSFGFNTGPGYDLPTGLGSIDAFNLVTKWTSLPPVAGTTITLTATPAAIPSSSTVQLTAAVTSVSGAGSPSGTVAFLAGNNTLGSTALTGSGPTTAATLPVKGASLASGMNTITASYLGNSTATATVLVTAPDTATPIPTSTVVTANPAAIGQSASTALTATVKQASGANAPTGTVAFATGGTSLGTANPVAGVAGLTVKGSSLAVGADTIVASFTATGNFGNSNGSVVVNVAAVNAAKVATGTSTALIATQANLTATVKALDGTAIPTGSVVFSAGNRTLGTAALSNSIATLPVAGSGLGAGSNSVVATYPGNAAFAGSASAPVTVTILPPASATSVVVTASPPAIAPNSTTVLTATVKASGTATGSISFATGNTVLGTIALNAGIAGLPVKGSSLAVGNNTITASYVGTGNFTNSSSSVTVSVTGTPTVTNITVSVSPGSKAATTVLTAIVKSAAGGSPSGSVTFALGSKLLGSSMLTASGAGGTGSLTLNNTVLGAGNNSIVVNYPGAAGFSSSTASVTVVH